MRYLLNYVQSGTLLYSQFLKYVILFQINDLIYVCNMHAHKTTLIVRYWKSGYKNVIVMSSAWQNLTFLSQNCPTHRVSIHIQFIFIIMIKINNYETASSMHHRWSFGMRSFCKLMILLDVVLTSTFWALSSVRFRSLK